jgi:hypothetical protein
MDGGGTGQLLREAAAGQVHVNRTPERDCASSEAVYTAGGWMPSALAPLLRAVACVGPAPVTRSAMSACRPRSSAVRASEPVSRTAGLPSLDYDHDRSHLGEFRSQLGLQVFEKPSGRPDLNRRPLDPQNGGVGVFAAQRRSACRIRRVATCGLFGRMDAVWSPSGPQRNRGSGHYLVSGLT